MINTDIIQGISDLVSCLGKEDHKLTCRIGKPDYWCQSNKQIDLVFPFIVWFRKLPKHLCGSLGVSNIGNLIVTSCFSNKVNLCRGIVVTHLSPTVEPVLHIFLWVECLVSWTVCGTSLVSEPNIVTLSDQLECGSDISIVCDPAEGSVYDTMLQEDCLSIWFGIL